MTDRTKKQCSINGCENTTLARGWCNKHYLRWKTHGDPEYERPGRKLCLIDDCENYRYGHGYCSKHYRRWKAHGDPLKLVQFESPKDSFETRTKWQGDCLVWTGATTNRGYGNITVDGKSQPAHRYAWTVQRGEIPDGMHIDHICHNRACVNVEHLRLATPSQNAWNHSGPQKNSTTGVRNVYRRRNSWRVKIRKNGVLHHFGDFPTVEEASRVAEQARIDLFSEFAGRG